MTRIIPPHEAAMRRRIEALEARVAALEGITAPPSDVVVVAHLAALVADMAGVSLAAIMGPSRAKEHAEARRQVYALAIGAGLTPDRVGRVMGRDRSTVAVQARKAVANG